MFWIQSLYSKHMNKSFNVYANVRYLYTISEEMIEKHYPSNFNYYFLKFSKWTVINSVCVITYVEACIETYFVKD